MGAGAGGESRGRGAAGKPSHEYINASEQRGKGEQERHWARAIEGRASVSGARVRACVRACGAEPEHQPGRRARHLALPRPAGRRLGFRGGVFPLHLPRGRGRFEASHSWHIFVGTS